MKTRAEAIRVATIVRVDNSTYEVVKNRLVPQHHDSVTQARHHVETVLRSKGGHCVVGEQALLAVRARLKISRSI